MRGAVDGLSIVTPLYGTALLPRAFEHRAASAEPEQWLGQSRRLFSVCIPRSLRLMPLWENHSLAFIQASGSPNETRSHFEAQDIIETAMMNTALATQGWMNGLAQILPDNHSPTRALSFGNTLPKIFQGKYDVAAVPAGLKANGNQPIENPQLEQALSQMYGSHAALGGLSNRRSRRVKA